MSSPKQQGQEAQRQVSARHASMAQETPLADIDQVDRYGTPEADRNPLR